MCIPWSLKLKNTIKAGPYDLIAYLEKKYNSFGNYHTCDPQNISMQVRIQDFLLGGSNLQRGSICYMFVYQFS